TCRHALCHRIHTAFTLGFTQRQTKPSRSCPSACRARTPSGTPKGTRAKRRSVKARDRPHLPSFSLPTRRPQAMHLGLSNGRSKLLSTKASCLVGTVRRVAEDFACDTGMESTNWHSKPPRQRSRPSLLTIAYC